MKGGWTVFQYNHQRTFPLFLFRTFERVFNNLYIIFICGMIKEWGQIFSRWKLVSLQFVLGYSCLAELLLDVGD